MEPVDPVTWKEVFNLGGFAVMSFVLFWLHRESLKVFREEIAAERQQCHEDHGRIGDKLEQANNSIVGMRADISLLRADIGLKKRGGE